MIPPLSSFPEPRHPLAGLEALLGRRLPSLLTAVLLLLVAAATALPHLRDPLWQDEAVTLLFHASHGPAYPFAHYDAPNNHIGFSAALSAWMGVFPDGVDLPRLRMLPFALFLAAGLATWLAARRLGGPLCALLAALAFVASPVSAGFATQLRGYGPSWLLFASMLLCGLSLRQPSRAAWRIGYALSAALAVVVLPSNLLLAAVVAAALAVFHLLGSERGLRSEAADLALLLLAPLAGLLAYAGIWHDLLAFGSLDLSPWSRAALASNWLRGTLADIVLLVPLVVAGAAISLWHLASQRRMPPPAGFALAFVAGLAVLLLAMPHAPFPRTLVPLLPVWYCALALLLSTALAALAVRARLPVLALLLAAGALAWGAGKPLAACRGASSAPSGYDLCYQYFHDRYAPETVVAVWAELGDRRVPIVADYEGFYALRVLGVPGLGVYQFEHFDPSGKPAPLLVVHGAPELQKIAGTLGIDPSQYRMVSDTGYFQVLAYVGAGAAP